MGDRWAVGQSVRHRADRTVGVVLQSLGRRGPRVVWGRGPLHPRDDLEPVEPELHALLADSRLADATAAHLRLLAALLTTRTVTTRARP
jgi:hypothetical protein